MRPQSVLSTASPGADLLSELTWTLFAGGVLILALVMALLALAIVSGPSRVTAARWIVGGGIVFPVVVLTVLLVYAFSVGAALSHEERAGALRVHVVGRTWWWEVHYFAPDGSERITLANELHLPAGCVVDLTLTTADVIHSFWVPSLAGKVDMIPGHENRLVLEPLREGVYRGQCAEYCGDQHANMAFHVVVESPEAFRRWLAHQALPAAEPATELLRSGRDAFQRGGCGVCHTVRGTPAGGRLGPDLTHVGSRLTLGAGAIANVHGAMAGWIVDSQTIKPGNLMPAMNVYTGPELRAVAAYLESLK